MHVHLHKGAAVPVPVSLPKSCSDHQAEGEDNSSSPVLPPRKAVPRKADLYCRQTGGGLKCISFPHVPQAWRLLGSSCGRTLEPRGSSAWIKSKALLGRCVSPPPLGQQGVPWALSSTRSPTPACTAAVGAAERGEASWRRCCSSRGEGGALVPFHCIYFGLRASKEG